MGIENRLKKDFLRIIEKLHRYKIARVESHISPNFEDPQNPIYPEITVRTTNLGLLRSLIGHLQVQNLGHQNYAKILINNDWDEQDKYYLRVYPGKYTPSNLWSQELEDFLKHIPHEIENYEKIKGHRKKP